MRTLLAALLVATACTRPAPPLPARPLPAQEVDGTTAHRVARAGVLRDADLPGYRRLPETTRLAGPRAGTCLENGTPSVTELGRAYRKGTVTVVTTASVAPSTAVVREDVAFMRGEFADCFERFLNSALAPEGIQILRYATARFRPGIRGADAAFGFRIRMTVRKEGIRAPLGAVVLAATKGHAELLLLAFGLPQHLPSTARLTALTTKVVARAATAER